MSADQNMICMQVMDEIAARHGVKVLQHEKPFAGVNGSGKHSNWGLNTDTGKNLFKPGKTEGSQGDFFAFTAALAYAPPRAVRAPSDAASRSAIRSSHACLLYTSPSPRDGLLPRMPSSA